MSRRNMFRRPRSRSSRSRVGSVPLVPIAVFFAVLLVPAVALANSDLLDGFAAAYPASASDDNAGCQLCHGPTTSTWNAYGKALADAGLSFAAIEGGQADSDPLGATNLQEINAGTQPGWTAGPNNTLYNRPSGSVNSTGQNPPAGIGTLDPASLPTATTLTIKAPRSVPKGTKARITGLLGSTEETCTDSQPLSLVKGTSVVSTTNTSATGSYKFVVKVRRKMTVYVTFAGTASCGASESSKKTIKVT